MLLRTCPWLTLIFFLPYSTIINAAPSKALSSDEQGTALIERGPGDSPQAGQSKPILPASQLKGVRTKTRSVKFVVQALDPYETSEDEAEDKAEGLGTSFPTGAQGQSRPQRRLLQVGDAALSDRAPKGRVAQFVLSSAIRGKPFGGL